MPHHTNVLISDGLVTHCLPPQASVLFCAKYTCRGILQALAMTQPRWWQRGMEMTAACALFFFLCARHTPLAGTSTSISYAMLNLNGPSCCCIQRRLVAKLDHLPLLGRWKLKAQIKRLPASAVGVRTHSHHLLNTRQHTAALSQKQLHWNVLAGGMKCTNGNIQSWSPWKWRTEKKSGR